MRQWAMIVIAALLLASVAACAPIPGSEVADSQRLEVVQLPDTRTIPAEWGNLAAVSNSSKFPDVFQLWFENEAGEIYLVVFDNQSRSLLTSSRVISRR